MAHDEIEHIAAKVAKFTGPHGGRCARPGASMTLRFNHAQADRDPNSCVFVGLVRHVLTVYLVNGALPPNLLGQIKARIA